MDICSKAREFALDAYGSERELEHPQEVRQLVRNAGADDEVQAAALLHDLVEDTDAQPAAIRAEFGPRVAAMVDALTEDGSIDDYLEKKREHRLRVRDSGRDAALVFVADKLSNARRMRRGQKQPDVRKFGHYGATLEEMRAAYPDLPLLDALERELRPIRNDLQRTAPA